MKTTIISLLLTASGVALGAEVTLLYGYDYNTAISGLQSDSTLTNIGTGSSGIGVIYGTSGALATSSVKFGTSGNGSYNTTSDCMINIQDSTGLGVSTDTGFSLTLNYKDNGDDWSNVASFTIGTSTYLIQTGANTRTVHIFAGTGSTALSNSVTLTDSDTTRSNAWYTLVLNAESTGFTFSMYSTDDTPELLSSATFTADSGNLTMFRQGADERNSSSIRVDNFGVYDGTLSDSMAISLINYENSDKSTLMTSIVPEPTTATLSLLALAGLAARRRRASR